MRILHTADWHVGKILRNQPRYAEHQAALGDLVRIANEEDVDVVVVAGDLFETSAPTPQAQGLVMKTLLALRAEGRHVVVLAGNHDSPRLIGEVFRPVLGELGMHVLGNPRPADSGGTVSLTTRSGETARVAALPFVSYRYAVRAAELILTESSDHNLRYASRIGQFIDALSAGFTDDTVNVVTTHGTLLGGRRGGGEREVQTLLGYELPAQLFPASAHYAALGHLHRYQEIDGPCPIAYSGSPIALDFGEQANESVALIVQAAPGARANIRPVPVAGGRRLRTLRGTLDQVIAEGKDAGDAYLRVVLAQQARAGLAEQVREELPNTLEVQIDEQFRPKPRRDTGDRPSRLNRTPSGLFADFLAEQQVDDKRVAGLFAELLEDVTGGQD
ncbi:MAG TPA: exonuclease SbcCD subunit D [Pseudonocardiaceae bacterium]|jgi:exonuclease SbcD|nr:exonuclease SbcCD subunit D [Pseudonocardiaceae bacterium]